MSETQKFTYDMSFSTMGRINFFLWKCNEATSMNDVSAWFNNIMVVYKETATYMTKEEKENNMNFLSNTKKSYREYLDFEAFYSKDPNSYSSYSPPEAVFRLLFSWELALREVLSRVGLLMKSEEDEGLEMI